jgi:hypothetical protein
MRLRGDDDRTVAGSWFSAAYLAALALILLSTAGELLRAAETTYGWVWAQAVVSVLALGLAWKRRHLLAAAATVAAVALDAFGRHGLDYLAQWEQPLAVLLLLPLIGRARPTPPPWFAVPFVPLIMLLEYPLYPFGLQWVALVVAAVIAVPVTVFDHRLGLTVALLGLLGIVNQGMNQKSFFWTFPEMLRAMWIPMVWPLAVLALSALLARRRARI